MMTEFVTRDLPTSPLYGLVSEHLSVAERIDLSHKRATAVGIRYALSPEDVLRPSKKFWDMYMDPIVTLDGGAVALFCIQLNLAAGTLAPFTQKRPDLLPLLNDMLEFRVSAQFLLTEVAHGLDAFNLETTATMKDDGSFDLHTPNEGAAKYMPPTLPFGGVPRVGLVMARLIVGGIDKGVRPFVVALNDGKEMCTGIMARELPTRSGSKAIGHALTYFDHVILPPSALLGEIDLKEHPRNFFLKTLWRVSIGSLSLSATVVPGLKIAAFIAAKYSAGRCVAGPTGSPISLISFRTQQLPILHSLAQGFALEALYRRATAWVSAMTPVEDINLRNAICAIVKATMIGHWRRTGVTVADRCGAQGTFDYNQLMPMEMELRGVAISEGDVLVLCLRLAPELLLGRYTVPPSQDKNSRLAIHEQRLFDEMKAILVDARGKHRGALANELLLPRCLPLVEAIGHRMAFEAAKDAAVPAPLVRLYELGVVGADLAAYVEYGLTSRRAFAEEEARALSEVYRDLDSYLQASGVERYAVGAIASQKAWDAFVKSLDIYSGNSSYTPFAETRARL
ncbi:uncharacterized protein PHACADRAFT_164229 [Phanerochaete carnosa HHB-10118-sp]|uniref:Acyl-CoA oxidase C-alpha1 domain-containing protein n=1 Tax=Phanerochaete carnosa (strain HHB-10118-sp) TaxID=650164 RepID=K5WPR7_PHACS|nr:uncharacterized protein PHACADRAFT_164229 [Phanerochaete carnosa HHB-10118-sp]EKM52307.1 hypothetical protein PHACADRAFT_164229 [Phanerochaete carnosa HHB-10118-sp]